MGLRRYAEDTSVPVSRSRDEIDRLLHQWGCSQLQWGTDFAGGRVQLRFLWHHGGASYLARFDLQLPNRAKLEKDPRCQDGRSGGLNERKLAAVLEAAGRQEHRVLLLYLKAAFNAVEAGLTTAETLFLPFLEDRDGRTVAEVALPHLARLHDGSAVRLLTDGDR
jgi:hypothetical protein